MALPLPNLDDRTYADLVEEVRALIPTYDPSWTDHNPSDPGVMLIELFVWLTEMLLYRANRVPDQHRLTFLKLLNGPDWEPSADLAEETRRSVMIVRQRYRAVTCEDYEALAYEASPEVARAQCVSRRHLAAGMEAERTEVRPGHISVIIVPHSEDPTPQPSLQLRQTIWNYLDPRRIVTTRHHVAGPIYVPVNAEMLVARRADMPAEVLRDQVVQALTDFLHPLRGGLDGNGWPFGRDVYVSELYQLLERIPGVDYVPDITLSSQCPPEAPLCVAATQLWHEEGDHIGLELMAHHLPRVQLDPNRIVISAVFVPVQVTVQVTRAESVTPAVLKRAVKTAVKRFFHPVYGGPDGTQTRTLTVASLRALVRALPEVATVVSVELHATRLIRDEEGAVTGARIETRELADVQVTVGLG